MTAARASSSRALDPRVSLLGDGGLESRQRASRARLEHGLRGFVSSAGIVGEQRQSAKRGVDRAAQPIVETHGVKIGRRFAARRLSGGGIGQRAGIVFDIDRLALGAEHQAAVLQGANDGFGSRAAAGGDFLDAGNGLAEIVGGEVGERLVEARGMRGRAAEREAEGQ